jgi:hypothetical protein
MGGKLLEPSFKILVQPRLVIVYENRSGDMHGVDEAQPLADAAGAQTGVHIAGNVDKAAAGGDFKPEFLTVGFHRLKTSLKNFVDVFAKNQRMAKQKFRPTRLGGFSGAKAYIRYVEVLKKAP